MARHRSILTRIVTVALLVAGAWVSPVAGRAQGTASPPAELKAFFDDINALRSDPVGNSNLIYDLAKARQADYATQPWFTTQLRGDGKTGQQHFADLSAWLKQQSPTAKLAWDADLATYAAAVTDQSFSARLRPDLISVQASYKDEKPEWMMFWWVLFSGGEDTIKPLLSPRLQYGGIVRRPAADPDNPEAVVVASSLKGKLYTRTDFSGFPYDSRIDMVPPNNTSYNELKIPEIISFVKADGTLDAAWRDQGKPPRIRITRYSSTGTMVWTREAGSADPAEYPYLAGFTEDPQGNMYLLKAKFETGLENAAQPATPSDIEPRLYDRPEMFLLTKLDSNGTLLWSKNLGKDQGGALATFSPMTPRIDGSGNETNVSTSRIAFTTLREPVYTLVADPTVVVPRNIAEKALLGYVTSPQGDKIDELFPSDFQATTANGVLTPKTFLITGKTLAQGNVQFPDRAKDMQAQFEADGSPKGVSGDTYSFDPKLYAGFLAYVQWNQEQFFDEFNKVAADKLKMRVSSEELPAIFHLYSSLTDYDSSIKSRHQQAYFRAVRADNGDPVLARNGWAFGHSFQNLHLVSDEGVITVERSDAGMVIANYMKYGYNRDHRVFAYRHAYDGNNSFSELGSIAPASDGYLVLFTTNHSPNPPQSLNGDANLIDGETAHSRDLAMVRIKKGWVDTLDKIGQFPFIYSSPTNPGSPQAPASLWALGGVDKPVYLTNLDSDRRYSATRPRMVRLADGSYVVFWERWTHTVRQVNRRTQADQSYDSTWAMLIDESGNTLKAAVQLPGTPRLMRGDDAFLYQGKAAWMSGDMVDGTMVLQTIDKGLSYQATVLQLP